MECPGCGYATRQWDGDDAVIICPECGVDALFPAEAAGRVRSNRYDRDPTADGPVYPDLGERSYETAVRLPASTVEHVEIEGNVDPSALRLGAATAAPATATTRWVSTRTAGSR